MLCVHSYLLMWYLHRHICLSQKLDVIILTWLTVGGSFTVTATFTLCSGLLEKSSFICQQS